MKESCLISKFSFYTNLSTYDTHIYIWDDDDDDDGIPARCNRVQALEVKDRINNKRTFFFLFGSLSYTKLQISSA